MAQGSLCAILPLTNLGHLCIIILDDRGIAERRRAVKTDKSLMSGSTTLLILSLLSGEEMYGYQMITELARRSNHVFDLKEGTLYPILHGLEAEGLVRVREKKSPEGRTRKYYRITRKGQKALDARREEWVAFRDQVDAVVNSAAPA
jgi:PadR family transcriptional regulator PadR